MPITIGNFINSLKAARKVDEASSKLSASYERLSSGLRINRASDDAAGLAVASNMRADARVFAQGIRNLNDGISLLSVADGALGELASITTRQLELAEQAANGTLSFQQRQALNAETASLTDEWNRIVSTTKFNGIGLLDNSLIGGLSIQAGTGSNGILSSAIGTYLSRYVGSGTFQTGVNYTSNAISFNGEILDVNGDGKNDIVTANDTGNSISVLIANGDGTFLAPVSYAGLAGIRGITHGDFNGDGKVDLVTSNFSNGSISLYLGNGNGTFNVSTSFAFSSSPDYFQTVGDINRDGKLDIVGQDAAGDRMYVFIGNGDGTFLARRTYGNAQAEKLLDFNNDGFLDAAGVLTTGGIAISYGNGDGTFQASTILTVQSTSRHIAVGDFNRDGYYDFATADQSSHTYSIILSTGASTYAAAVSAFYDPVASANVIHAGDFNSDGLIDLALGSPGAANHIVLGNGNGSFQAAISLTTSSGYLMVGDLNGDGIDDIAGANNTSVSVSIMNKTRGTSEKYIGLFTADSARSAITELKATLDRVTGERGTIGAYESRFKTAINVLASARSNTLEALGRIEDVDVAEETASMVRLQIAQQAATAILAQSNLTASLVLKLLE